MSFSGEGAQNYDIENQNFDKKNVFDGQKNDSFAVASMPMVSPPLIPNFGNTAYPNNISSNSAYANPYPNDSKGSDGGSNDFAKGNDIPYLTPTNYTSTTGPGSTYPPAAGPGSNYPLPYYGAIGDSINNFPPPIEDVNKDSKTDPNNNNSTSQKEKTGCCQAMSKICRSKNPLVQIGLVLVFLVLIWTIIALVWWFIYFLMHNVDWSFADRSDDVGPNISPPTPPTPSHPTESYSNSWSDSNHNFDEVYIGEDNTNSNNNYEHDNDHTSDTSDNDDVSSETEERKRREEENSDSDDDGKSKSDNNNQNNDRGSDRGNVSNDRGSDNHSDTDDDEPVSPPSPPRSRGGRDGRDGKNGDDIANNSRNNSGIDRDDVQGLVQTHRYLSRNVMGPFTHHADPFDYLRNEVRDTQNEISNLNQLLREMEAEKRALNRGRY